MPTISITIPSHSPTTGILHPARLCYCSRMMLNPVRKIRDRESGFTLIEIMVAVTILAIIATVAFTVVFGAVKRSRHIDRQLELYTEAANIVGLISEDLRSAFVQEGVVPFMVGVDGFKGENQADGISLLTTAVIPVSPNIPAGGVGEVEYFVQESENGPLILMRREQTPARMPYDSGGESIEITDHLKSLNLKYSDGDNWYDGWDTESTAPYEKGKLPKQVSIELVLEDGEYTVTFHGSVAPVMAVGR